MQNRKSSLTVKGKSRSLTHDEIVNEAKLLAAKLQEQYPYEIKNYEDQCRESLWCLLDEQESAYTATDYMGFIVELMATLIRPEVTSKMEGWYKDHAGEMLKEMYSFFQTFDSENYKIYNDWVTLSRFSGGLAPAELDRLQEHYEKKIKAA